MDILLSGSYGLFLPDISTILLNAAALDNYIRTEGRYLEQIYAEILMVNNPVKLFAYKFRC